MNLKKIIIIAVAALVLLIVIGVVLFMFVFNKDATAKEEPAVYFEFPLGEMYSNIKEENKILKSSPVIQYTDEDLLDTLTKNQTRIKNDVFQIYRTRSFEQLTQPNGQERLREDIQEMIVEILEVDSEVISDVYFVEFILQ